MAKFRIRLKVQALELEVDGEREDIPAITAAVQQQFAGLVQPAEALADGHKQLESGGQVPDAETEKNKNRAIRKRSSAGKSSTDLAGQPIDFPHDSPKYGNPQQTWSLLDKCIWLLAVVKGITGTPEVGGPQLAATFNQYFKSSGKLHPPNVTRELGRAKLQNPAAVGEDKGLWFLTDEGDRQAQQLIQGVLSSTAGQ